MALNVNVTEGFVQTHGLGICRGGYAPALLKEWHRWDASHGSENDPVDAFPDDQLFVVFVFADGGVDLEHFELRSFQEAQSILLQASNLTPVLDEFGCVRSGGKKTDLQAPASPTRLIT